MANKLMEMSKVRQIIKLYASQELGKKKIAVRLGISKNTVKQYVDLFLMMKRSWEELSSLTDYELNKLFHPPKAFALGTKLQGLFAYFPVLEKEMRRRGMTIKKQYEAYKQLHPDGYQSTMFHVYYQRWRKKQEPSLPIEHKIGDKLYVDFAGETLPYVDTDTGEVKQSQVFVATLGWSGYTYIEALENQSISEFIRGCENALHHIQGVPLAIVPDNLKSAVMKAHKYEPLINAQFQSFADHYAVAISPARSRKPKDKAPVENMVKLAYKEIYTQVSPQGMMPLADLNKRIHQELERFNAHPFTGQQESRMDHWNMERPFLQALPKNRYEIYGISQCTVMKNGHVYLSADQHYYSVPYELIGEKLKMHYTRSEVRLFKQYELVATHPRIKSKHKYSTIKTHLSPAHQLMTEWSSDYFIQRGLEIDEVVGLYIRKVLEKKPYPEQAYRSCQGILSFEKRVGKQRLVKACIRANQFELYNYRIIEDILKRNLEESSDQSMELPMPQHENIRGGHYYQ